MLIFYDLETTGLNPYHEKITEVCFLKYLREDPRHTKFTTLINPKKKLSNTIVKITNITDEMLQDKPTFEEIGTDMFRFILDGEDSIRYFIAHNGDVFDRIFLKEHFNMLNIKLKDYSFMHIDTLLFAKKMYSELRKFNLGYLCEKLEILKRTGHRAENDTLMLADLYKKMCNDLAIRNNLEVNYYINNTNEIYDFIYN